MDCINDLQSGKNHFRLKQEVSAIAFYMIKTLASLGEMQEFESDNGILARDLKYAKGTLALLTKKKYLDNNGTDCFRTGSRRRPAVINLVHLYNIM